MWSEGVTGASEGAGEGSGTSVVSKGLEGGSPRKCLLLSAWPYAGKARPPSSSSSLLVDSSSDLRSREKLLAEVDWTDEVREELSEEERRSVRSEKEHWLRRREKGAAWLESKKEACEGEERSGAISTGGAMMSAI